MFGKKQPSLHEIHQQAEARSADALSLFHSVADDLEVAADMHKTVYEEADQRARQLKDLADSAVVAEDRKRQQAQAIRDLVG